MHCIGRWPVVWFLFRRVLFWEPPAVMVYCSLDHVSVYMLLWWSFISWGCVLVPSPHVVFAICDACCVCGLRRCPHVFKRGWSSSGWSARAGVAWLPAKWSRRSLCSRPSSGSSLPPCAVCRPSVGIFWCRLQRPARRRSRRTGSPGWTPKRQRAGRPRRCVEPGPTSAHGSQLRLFQNLRGYYAAGVE